MCLQAAPQNRGCLAAHRIPAPALLPARGFQCPEGHFTKHHLLFQSPLTDQPLCLAKTTAHAGLPPPAPRGSVWLSPPRSRFSRPASHVTNTLFRCIKAKSFTVLLQLSWFYRLRGLTARLFGPVGLEMTHKSFLFQTQLVVRKHISILSYGPPVSQELSVPVVMITREMWNGMSKQPHLIHTCVPHHEQSPCG